MKLTEKNLMVGDWLQYYIGEEGLEWEPTKIDWQDIKEVSENPEKFNKRHRPIALTEEVLRKIEGVRLRDCPSVNGMRQAIIGKNPVTHDFLIVLYKWDDDDFWFYQNAFHKIIHLHQLQQLSRCLGHELVINF